MEGYIFGWCKFHFTNYQQVYLLGGCKFPEGYEQLHGVHLVQPHPLRKEEGS